jgi:hypothetical protein
MRVPTDLQILSAIWSRYYPEFARYARDELRRKTKIYVPISIEAIATELKVDGDIVFGRLYYHLEQKHGYQRGAKEWVHLFALEVGGDRHCVNFPLMASVLAGLQQEDRQFQVATWIAWLSLAVSVFALYVSASA